MPMIPYYHHVCDQCGFTAEAEANGPAPAGWVSMGFSDSPHAVTLCSWVCVLQFVAAEMAGES